VLKDGGAIEIDVLVAADCPLARAPAVLLIASCPARLLPQIVPINFEHHPLRVQPVEIGNAIVAAHHGLAVIRDRANPQTAGDLDDQREGVRPVITAPGEQADASSLPTNMSR
jgi:hypothetical protein